MHRLRSFANLSGAERGLFFRALFLVAAVRVGLWLLPFRAVQRRILRTSRSPSQPYPLGHVVRAIKTAGRYVPGATCLTQALACQALLLRSSYESRLEIGVAKDEQLRFAAHAWVVCGQQIVIGAPENEKYTPLGMGEQRF